MDLLKTVGWFFVGISGLSGLIVTMLLPGKVIQRRRKIAAAHPPERDGQDFLADAPTVIWSLGTPATPAAPNEPTPLAGASFDTVPWSAEGLRGAQVEVWTPWGYESPEFDGTWRKTRKEITWQSDSPRARAIPAETTSRLAKIEAYAA